MTKKQIKELETKFKILTIEKKANDKKIDKLLQDKNGRTYLYRDALKRNKEIDIRIKEIRAEYAKLKKEASNEKK